MKVTVELLVPRRSTNIRHMNEINVAELTLMGSDEQTEEIDQSPVKTIKVQGISKLYNRDSVHLYFESLEKSGETRIKELFNDNEDENIIYIRYEDESAARKVAERQHPIDGHNLGVSLYVPPITPPNYTNKLLIKGLNPRITFSVLELFMEARAGISLVYIIYHVDRQDTALAIVDGVTEMHVSWTKLEDACKSKPLEGSILRLCPVPMSNCVHVSNIRSVYTEDTIALYFENVHRSYGGPVDKVKIFVEKKCCIVFFKDYKVVDNVLSKKHTLDGKPLVVKRYIPCIGKTEDDIVGRSIKMPKPFEIKTNSNKKKFLGLTVIKKTLQRHMSKCYALVKWPTDIANKNVEIFCTLSENVEDFEGLAKNWKENAKTTFDDFMNKLNMDGEHEVKVEIHQRTNEIKLTGLNIMVKCIQVEEFPTPESFPDSDMNKQTNFLNM
ncbi:hypothetical protein DPMN_071717 [Dreissena polymorpha]|uniref:RRM domain-containing protein n=1 Tax=Dreissena polymorpha TaxID=45954 RepID=A0A9D4BVZ7_DREPO|nr:hypothetical protein DPMN_071717 [Dreissena polymorpha]